MFWALDFILMSTDTEDRDWVGITSIFIVLVFTCNESLLGCNQEELIREKFNVPFYQTKYSS